ncbi:transposase family protein [Streptomyces sp. 900105755]
MPDPRDPRGVRHALVAVLALTACAVLDGATSVLSVSEWIAAPATHPGTPRHTPRPTVPEAVPACGNGDPAAAGPHRPRTRARFLRCACLTCVRSTGVSHGSCSSGHGWS